MSTTPKAENITVSMLNMDTVIAYIVSDVHLTTSQARHFHRENFVSFLRDLNRERTPQSHIVLVLNGDILDVSGSWHADCLPWNSNNAQVESTLLCVLGGILDEHADTVSELRELLEHGGEIIYVFGNHDRLISLFPAAQELLRQRLCPLGTSLDRLHFQSPELGLYVEHGQRFDPFNQENYQQRPPIGDVINILIVNRFVDKVVSKLLEAGYSPDLVGEMEGVLQ